MALRKDIIKEAALQAKNIEQSAIEFAKKEIMESLAPQIEETVKNSLMELENSSNETSTDEQSTVVSEDLQINVATDGSVSISGTSDGAPIELDNTGSSSDETSTTTNTDTEEMDTVNNHEEEMFEIDLSEEGEIPAPPIDNAAPPAETEPVADLNTIDDKLQDMASKIETILSAVAPSGGEGDVQVVDDEAQGDPAAGAPAPAPAAPAPAPTDNQDVVAEDDVMFEIDQDMMNALAEMDFMSEESLEEGESIEEEINISELNDLDEVVIDEDEDDSEDDSPVDEMKGLGSGVNRLTPNRNKFNDKDHKHAPVNEAVQIQTIKAQYESKIDELIKENAGLQTTVEKQKGDINDFKNSFIELRQQVDEMVVFNGKLAFANKLFYNGGLTNDEKKTIAEAFDKVETIDEAKKLYNKFINEMNLSQSTNTSPIDKLKTSKPAVAKDNSKSENTSQAQAIYESVEMKRMKKLAGILKEGGN